MTDTDFEKRAALLTNSGYFDRVRELCKSGMGVEDAWMQTESELPFGLRRFTHFVSFTNAKNKEAQGSLPLPAFKATH